MTDAPHPFRANAHAYWNCGLSVVPVQPGSKAPAVKEWASFTHNQPRAAKRAEWLETYGHCNIGLLLGTPLHSGHRIAAIDVDDDGYVRVVETILGKSPVAKRGAKGLTIFVRAESTLKSTKHGPKGAGLKIEIFASSGQTVLPPSKHPSGVNYQWIGTPLAEANFDELPVLDSAKVALLTAVGRSEHAAAVIAGGKTHDPLLRLAARLVSVEADDDRLVSILTALLPTGYEGNAVAEIPEMIRSARGKGFGGGDRLILGYDPGETGPVPLGFASDGRFLLRDPVMRRVTALSSSQMVTAGTLLGLASGSFWADRFPSEQGFSSRIAGDALMEICRLKGSFPMSRVRGRGVWREKDRLVINHGGPLPNNLTHVYVCSEILPELEPGNFHAGDVLDLFQLFNWITPADAMFLLGWCAIAPICGALAWRPHLFLHGPKNTGKTTLVRIINNLLTPLGVTLDGQSTEAGIRQKLGPDSLPVILDEFESDSQRGRMQGVVKLARSASSAEGAVARGTPDGKALEYNIRTTFLFAAINPWRGTAADSSRIVQLQLAPHDNSQKTKGDILQGLRWLETIGSQWCWLSLNLAAVMLDSITDLEVAMPAMESRHAQNMAVLLGGAWTVLERRRPSPDEAAAWVKQHLPAIEIHGQQHDESDSEDCLEHLLGWREGSRELGEAMAFNLAHEEEDHKDGPIKANGIVLDRDRQGFWVANKHPGLDKIFRGTRWEGGGWNTGLERIEGAEKGDRHRIDGIQIRGVWLPATLLPPAPPKPEYENGNARY